MSGRPGASNIAESKLVSFAVGQQKKTRFQKAREEKEAKRKQEEAEVAKVYDSFVASFTHEEDDGSKTFVRGGRVEGGRPVASANGTATSTASSSGGELYKLAAKRPRLGSGISAFGSADDQDAAETEAVPPTAVGGSRVRAGGNKTRQIDDFLNEIKNRQEGKVDPALAAANGGGVGGGFDGASSGAAGLDLPGGRGAGAAGASWGAGAAFGMSKGSFDNGDPYTTNLYIGNLAPTTTEEHLLDLFGKFGEINSVKVMWPRTDEERARKRNCGFVSFKLRSDAEDAMMELQDYELEEYRMVIGWGKAVKINQAIFSLTRSDRLNQYSGGRGDRKAGASGGGGKNSQAQSGQAAGRDKPPPPPEPAPVPASAPAAEVAQLSVDSFLDSIMGGGGGGGGSSGPATSAAALTTAGSGASAAASTAAVAEPAPAPSAAAAATAVDEEEEKEEEIDLKPGDACIRVVMPTDMQRKVLLDVMAKYVAADGESFEKSIKVREEANPDYRFLFEPDSEEGQYYRWRTFANAWGDSLKEWRVKPVRMSRGGIVVVPPPLPTKATTAPAAPTTSAGSGDGSGSGGGGVMDMEERWEHRKRPRSDSCASAASTGSTSRRGRSGYKGRKSYSSDDEEGGDEGRHRPRSRSRRSFSRSHSPSPSRTSSRSAERHGFSSRDRGRGTGRRRPRRDSRSSSSSRSPSRSPSRSHSRGDSSDSRSRSSSPDTNRRSGPRRSSETSALEAAATTTTAAAAASGNAALDRLLFQDYREKVEHDWEERERQRQERDKDRARRGLPPLSTGDGRGASEGGGAGAAGGGGTGELRGKYAGMTGAQIEREKARLQQQQKARLSKEDYRQWKALLRSLSLSRASVRRAMGFAYDKIEAADEIVKMICERLIRPSSYAAVKIAGLYLLSDILHNAAAPVKHASNYRALVQAQLPTVVESIAEIYRKTNSRMASHNIEDRMQRLFSALEDSSVLSAPFLRGLQASFYMPQSECDTMHRYLQLKAQEDEAKDEEGRKQGGAGTGEGGDDLETVRRRARLAGLAFDDSTSIHELNFRLDFVERHSQQQQQRGLGQGPGPGQRSGFSVAATDGDDGSGSGSGSVAAGGLLSSNVVVSATRRVDPHASSSTSGAGGTGGLLSSNVVVSATRRVDPHSSSSTSGAGGTGGGGSKKLSKLEQMVQVQTSRVREREQEKQMRRQTTSAAASGRTDRTEDGASVATGGKSGMCEEMDEDEDDDEPSEFYIQQVYGGAAAGDATGATCISTTVTAAEGSPRVHLQGKQSAHDSDKHTTTTATASTTTKDRNDDDDDADDDEFAGRRAAAAADPQTARRRALQHQLLALRDRLEAGGKSEAEVQEILRIEEEKNIASWKMS